MSGPVPTEQGATRRLRAVDLVRAYRVDRNGRPYFDTDALRNKPTRPPWAPATFGRRGVERAYGPLLRRGAGLPLRFISPAGRFLDAWDVGQWLADYIRRWNEPKRIVIPGTPANPTYGELAALGWIMGPNWRSDPLPPDYQEITNYLRNPSTFRTRYPNNTPAGWGTPLGGDWSTVLPGEIVYLEQEGYDTINNDGRSWWSNSTGYAIRTATSTDPAGSADEERWIPGYASPLVPTTDPNFDRWTWTLEEPQLEAVGQASNVTTLQRSVAAGTATAVEIAPEGKFRVAPTFRVPARGNEKQKKVLSKTRAFAVALFGALDTVSELSEIIDVFYQAIPKEYRKAEEKALGWHWAKVNGKWKWLPPRHRSPLMDSAGQYGLEGADWKAGLVWKYWYEIDTEAAFLGLINNQTQDFVYGKVHQNVPKNSGVAFDAGFKEIESALREYVYR